MSCGSGGLKNSRSQKVVSKKMIQKLVMIFWRSQLELRGRESWRKKRGNLSEGVDMVER